MSLAIATTATLALLLEIIEKYWVKRLNKLLPKLTPPGYLRSQEQIQRENEERQKYERLRPKHENISFALLMLKYILAVSAVILAWLEAL